MFALEVKNLVKSYGPVKAVKNISFGIKKGECFGLLGPNGAGKSTTIEIIEQIQKQDKGDVLYFGKPPTEAMREELGVQFQETALLPRLTTRECLEVFSGLYTKRVEVSELIKLCQLEEFSERFHEKLSGGQKQRLLLAIAMSNQPKILLLDEPTTGLDPQARRHLWNIIQNLKSAGATIILTTHYMDEAEALCDRIVIVDHGEIIAEGEPRTLIRNHLPEVVVEIPVSDFVTQEILEKSLPHEKIQLVGQRLQVSTKKLDLVLRALSQGEIPLEGLHVRQPNLEDLFIALTGKALRS
jgi:ABC-2 type transport system ATP-binding protein